MDYRDFEMTDLTQEERLTLNAKKFADMLIEYDTGEEQEMMIRACKKWAKQCKSDLEIYRKVYNFAKQFWNEEELKQTIITECFEREYCEEIFK